MEHRTFIAQTLNNFSDYFFWSCATRIPFDLAAKDSCDIATKIVYKFDRVNSIFSKDNCKKECIKIKNTPNSLIKLSQVYDYNISYIKPICFNWVAAMRKNLSPIIVVAPQMRSYPSIFPDWTNCEPLYRYYTPLVLYRAVSGKINLGNFNLYTQKDLLELNEACSFVENFAITKMQQLSNKRNIDYLLKLNNYINANYGKSFIKNNNEDENVFHR